MKMRVRFSPKPPLYKCPSKGNIMHYEFHVTLDRVPERYPRGWKHTTFLNVDHKGQTIREDIPLSKQKELDTRLDSGIFLHNEMKDINRYMNFSPGDPPPKIIRTKIETGPTEITYAAVYHEAHFKLNRWVEHAPHGYIHRSINKETGAHWRTIRSSDYRELHRQYVTAHSILGDAVIEQEIESVLYDTAPMLDVYWLIGIVPEKNFL